MARVDPLPLLPEGLPLVPEDGNYLENSRRSRSLDVAPDDEEDEDLRMRAYTEGDAKPMPSLRRKRSAGDRMRRRLAEFAVSLKEAAKSLFRLTSGPVDDFWLRYLSNVELSLDLPFDKANLDNGGGGRLGGPIQSFSWTLPIPPQFQAVSSELMAGNQAMAPIVMLFATWSALLGRMARSTEFVSGFSADVGPAEASVFPTGVVPLVVATETKDGAALGAGGLFRALTDELQRLRAAVQTSGPVHFETLTRALGVSTSDETTHPLFQTAFVVGAPLSEEKELWSAVHMASDHSAPLALQLRVKPPAPGAAPTKVLVLQLLFWEDLVSIESAMNLKSQLGALFGLVAGQKAQLSVPLQDLPSIGAAQEGVLKAWSDQTDYAKFKPGQIHERFLQCAAKTPGSRALVDSKEDGTEDVYTYGELHSICLALCRRLQESYGVGFDSMVPLLFERGVRMVVAIYGVLMAGGAYVPLEPHYPGARVLSILEQVQPRVTVTTPAHSELLRPGALGAEEGAWPVLGLGMLQRAAGRGVALELLELHAGAGTALAPPPALGREEAEEQKRRQEAGQGLVYVFFTSGSTGKPKGVMCEHAGLRHRIEWMHSRYGLQPEEATVLKHAYTFGISEWEMFWPLAVGATLVVPKPGGEKDPEYVFDLCARHPVTVMYMVPSMLNMLLDYVQAEEKDPVEAGFSLRQVITCGEPLQEETIQQHFRLLHEAELDNLYGPTEGSMTVWRCPRGQRIPQVPIGAPISGIRVYSLAGSNQRLAEVNVPGEIHFAGQFIARGYLGLPGQTAQAFLPDTVLGQKYPSERMYKTGDLACWKPNGQLQFLGRADNQIKLRGFRIEIGEIEAVVRGAGGVKDAVVVLAGEGDSKFLAAYVAPTSVDLDALRATCSGKLPHYMVPSAFAKLDRLPVTDRGKLDKKALPPARPEGQAASKPGAGGVVPPRTELEKTIVATFAEALNLDPASIGIESDFVSIGGNSVLAGRVTSRLRKILNLPLPGTALYKKPTPAQLAQLATEMREALGNEEDDQSEEEEKSAGGDAPEQRHQGLSASRPMALLLTSVIPVLEILSTLTSLLSFLETMLLKVLHHVGVPLTGCSLFLVIALLNFVFAPALILVDLLVGLIIKRFFIGKLTEGSHSTFSPAYFRWLYSQKIMETIVKAFQNYFIGTSALNAVYRLFGAQIGRGVVIYTKEVFKEPELITIEDGVLLDEECKITCSSVGDGQLMLHPVRIGQGARARPYSAVGRGACLAPGHELVATGCLVGYGGRKVDGLVTGGKVAKLKRNASGPPKSEPCLRLAVGVPLLFLIDALSMVPSYILSLWLVDSDWLAYIVVVSVIGEHLHRAALVTLTVVTKWLLVGRVRPGSKADEGSWSGMCHWVVRTLIERDDFKQALEGFINTEVLRFVFVLLGAKIGRRASMDMIQCTTPDLLSIGDYMLFGSKVGILCEDEGKRKAVQICRGANVLDNCVLCPGVTVGQRAILGTNTLAAPGQYFPPDTINTGNKGGQAVFLRKKGKGAPATVALEAEANRRLESIWTWTAFNIGLCIVAMLEPALRAVKTLPFILALCLPIPFTESMCLAVLTMALEEFVEAALLFLLKWTVIGTFKEREVVFFGLDHFKWMVWLMVSSTFNHLDGFHGTALYSAFLRAMGAEVGRDCTLFGFTLEFDLLHIGDCAHVGPDCDNTCHTVENMVLKMVPVRLGAYSTMQRHSFVMPGAELGKGAVLFEESQVLKGEAVPPDEVWAGNPAEPLRAPPRPKLWQVPRLAAQPATSIRLAGGAAQRSQSPGLANGKSSLKQPLLA